MNSKKPGYCLDAEIHHVDSRLFRQMAEFINPQYMLREPMRIADVGSYNAKSDHMRRTFGVGIVQIENRDFNFRRPILHMKFDTILCFEVLEHLQNPLLFLRSLIKELEPDGVLYLSTPHRPKLLWTSRHFIEYSPRRLKKWILEPLDLTIVRKKHLHINHHWSFYLKGIRPMLRLFFNWTVIYEIRKR